LCKEQFIVDNSSGITSTNTVSCKKGLRQAEDNTVEKKKTWGTKKAETAQFTRSAVTRVTKTGAVLTNDNTNKGM
jgi:hypothetical protein